MKNRLFEIGKELGDIAQQRAQLYKQITDAEKETKKREVDLIPEGGWPGSNDMQRKAFETKAKESDTLLLTLRSNVDLLKENLDELGLKRDILMSERDAYQWTIRDNEVWATSGKTVFGE